MRAEIPSDERCRNCEALLHGRFCAECGQRRLGEGDRRLGHLLGQFFGALTDLDSRFWRSFRALLFRPGRLSRDYIDGRRARWLAPVTVFVLVNVLYFLAPALTDFSLPFYNQVPGHLALASFENEAELSPQAHERIRDWPGQLHSPLTAPWVERRIERRNADQLERSGGRQGYTVADYARRYDAAVNEISKVLIVLHVPFIALALMLVFRARRLYYAEHFVVALHLFAFIVLFIEISLGPMSLVAASGFGGEWFRGFWSWWRPLGAALVFAYVAVALRRVYDVGWWWAVGAGTLTLLTLAVSHFVYRLMQFLVIFAIT